MLTRSKDELHFPYVNSDKARVEFFRRGAIVKFATSSTRDECAEAPAHIRGVIRDQSSTSRRRCAHAFGNARCRWVAMLCLTWHDIPPPEVVKAAWRSFRDAWKGRFGEPPDAWLMEMQTRGAPHFHLFIAREGIVGGLVCAAIEDGSFEDVSKTSARGNGRCRRIVRAEWTNIIGRMWIECSLQDYTADALWWHTQRGIVEIVDNEDAAGRYVAKESSKREQKELPEHYSKGLGRWWWLDPRWKPEPWGEGEMGDLQKSWPWDVPIKYVWEGKQLAGCITAMRVYDTWEGKDMKAVREIAESTWDVSAPFTKTAYMKPHEWEALQAKWSWNDMLTWEPCDSVWEDIVCEGNRIYDGELRSFICKKCFTIRLASAAECERIAAI